MYGYYNFSSYDDYSSSSFSTMSFVYILGIILTIGLMILAYMFIVPEKRRPKLNKLGQFLHDAFNFKFLLVEKVMQFFYLLATISTIAFGISMLFGFYHHSYGPYSETEWYGLYGLLTVILGPIAIRIAYELLMLFILLVKNVIQINRKLGSQVPDVEYQFPSFKELVAKENFSFLKKKKNVPQAPNYYNQPAQPQNNPENQQPGQ